MKQYRDKMALYIDKLDIPERERKMMEYRFGLEPLDTLATHTLEETGKLFGVTRERIRQIESKVFEKIVEYEKLRNIE